MLHPRGTFFSFGLICCGAASSISASSQAHDALLPATYTENPSNEPKLTLQDSLSSSMQKSLQTLKRLETLPSCPKVAAAALIHSCSTLEGSIHPDYDDIARGTDFFLHEEMNVFAARLAICELDSTKVPVPLACASFVPTRRTAKTSYWRGYFSKTAPSKPHRLYPEYDESTQEDLDQCISALRAESQTWTSFSNSKQNAVVVCHSMRGEVERDEQIHLHKILYSATQEAVNALFKSKEDWEEFRAGYTELSGLMRQAHFELSREHETRLEAARQFWTEWESKFQNDLQDLSSDIQQIRHEVNVAHDGLHKSNLDIQAILHNFSIQVTDLALHHSSEISRASTDAVALQQVMRLSSEILEQNVAQNIYKIVTDVGLMDEVVAMTKERIDNYGQALMSANDNISRINTRLQDVELTLEKIEEAAQSVDKLNRSLGSIFSLFNDWRLAFATGLRCAEFVGFAICALIMFHLLRWLLMFLRWPPRMLPFRRKRAIGQVEMTMHNRPVGFRLPVNDPKTFAKMARV